MKPGRIDADAYKGLGEMIGFAAAGFWEGIKAGWEEFKLVAAAQDVEAQEEEKERAMPAKTRIAECRRCWCDQCDKMEGCEMFPCHGCGDGTRFMPCEEERCGEFAQSAAPNNG
jgi:hypothetical protein